MGIEFSLISWSIVFAEHHFIFNRPYLNHLALHLGIAKYLVYHGIT